MPFKNKSDKIFWDYRRRSTKKNFPFELEKETFKGLLKNSCHYCGSEASPFNGIDRVDNSQGYVPGNVVTCCKTCNFLKHSLSVDTFLGQVQKIYLKQFLKVG